MNLRKENIMRSQNLFIFVMLFILSLSIAIFIHYAVIQNFFNVKYNLIFPDSRRYYEQIYSALNQLQFRGYFNLSDINSFLDIYLFILYNFSNSFLSVLFVNCFFYSAEFFLLYLSLKKISRNKSYSLIATLIIFFLPSNLQFTTQILKDTFVQFSIILIFFSYIHLIDIVVKRIRHNSIYLILNFILFIILINFSFLLISFTRSYLSEFLVLVLLLINLFILILNIRYFVSVYHSMLLLVSLSLCFSTFILSNINKTEDIRIKKIQNSQFISLYKKLHQNDFEDLNKHLDTLLINPNDHPVKLVQEKQEIEIIIKEKQATEINQICYSCRPDYNNWKYNKFIPQIIENQLIKVAANRYNFIATGGYLTNKKNLYEFFDFVNIMPETILISFLYPLPTFSIKDEISTLSKIQRLVAELEMTLFYISYLGFFYFWYKNKSNIFIYPPLIISFLFIYLNSTVIMNLGTLYRHRSSFLIIFVSLGIIGMLQLISNKKIK